MPGLDPILPAALQSEARNHVRASAPVCLACAHGVHGDPAATECVCPCHHAPQPSEAAKPAKKPVARYLASYVGGDSRSDRMTIEAKSDRAAARIAATYELDHRGFFKCRLTSLLRYNPASGAWLASSALEELVLRATHWLAPLAIAREKPHFTLWQARFKSDWDRYMKTARPKPVASARHAASIRGAA